VREKQVSGWWLEASNRAMGERNTVGLEACAPAEHGQ